MKIAGPVVLLAFILPSSAMAQRATTTGGSVPIAILSVQRILTEAKDAKAATARLEELRQAKGREVTAKRQEVEKTHQELLQNGGVFRGAQRAKLKADEDRQRAELQRLTEQAQSDVQTLQRQLQDDLRRKMAAILADIAKRRKMEIVLNQDAAVVWAIAGYDVTSEVLEKLNAVAAPASSPK
jgi:outer membrane protein